MSFTHSLDINNTLNIPSSHIEKKQNIWRYLNNNLNNNIDNINSKLDWLKLELPKTSEQQEKEVLNLVQNKWLKKSFESWTYSINEVIVKKIKNWIFLLSSIEWNAQYYIDNNWEIIFWIENIVERPFVKNWKAFEYAGFIEKKENGIYNMYKIKWNKEILVIDINSIEYYNAWQDIIFYADIYNKLATLKMKYKSDKLDIRLFAKHWSFRFEDLELFLDKWLITQEVFEYWIIEIRKKVVSQCSDLRLIKLWIWIKEIDLKKYLDKWYINKNIALKCYNNLPDNMRINKKN